jgi:hypothetical protein
VPCLFISFQIQKERQWLYAKKKWGFDCLAYSTKFILWPGLADHVCGRTSRTLFIVKRYISRDKQQLPSCLASSARTKVLYAAELLFPFFKTLLIKLKKHFSLEIHGKNIFNTQCPYSRDSTAYLKYLFGILSITFDVRLKIKVHAVVNVL